MGKEKLVFNAQTLSYEKAKVTLQQKLIRVFGFLSTALVSAFLLTFAMHNLFPSPREAALRQEIAILESEYENVLDDLKVMEKVLGELRERDANAFRLVFGMPPVDNDVLQGGIGGSDDYVSYRNMSSAKILIETKEKVRNIKHKITVQSKSLDSILDEANKKENELASIPSIKPVRSDKLAKSVGLLSGFGYRIHPIFKVSRMHYGIDFTAPKGTAIQATGNGVVIKAEYKSGYGRHVVISHGYGYETLYAHMDKILVKKGQKVTRGQQIGKVGSSGTSTAPHCHYEVHLRGKPVNPIQFVLDGLSPKEYDKLVKAAETTNQSFD